jgi:dTDP-4-amino-4,6-dideoxygalactose transaminase
MKVPFNDLRRQHEELRAEIQAAFDLALDKSAFVGGGAVQAFEANFAQYCGARHAIGVANGTEALRLALQALDVGPGQAVITVPNTFIATAEAITLVGAHPIFVDIDPVTYTLDPAALRRYLETHCRRDPSNGRLVDLESGSTVTTVIPVHLYGFPAAMTEIHSLARQYGLALVEDAAQAHGATYTLQNGRTTTHRAGSTGQFGCFSMYPGKNLGALGEAGAIVTNDSRLAEKVRLLANHGQTERYIHVTPVGTNGRLDSLQAAFLDLKLKRLDDWNDCRREIAAHYAARLADSQVVTPSAPAYGEHIYHVYLVQVDRRDEVRRALADQGVETGLHYPVPLHLQKAFAYLELGPGSYPVTEAVARRLLSLPMYPHLEPAQVDYVCDALLRATE